MFYMRILTKNIHQLKFKIKVLFKTVINKCKLNKMMDLFTFQGHKKSKKKKRIRKEKEFINFLLNGIKMT